MIKITSKFSLDEAELQFSYIRAPGPGGQNVNKVATGVQLRFKVVDSKSLPEEVRVRLTNKLAKKLTVSGELVIKAVRYRTQARNKDDAVSRLRAILEDALHLPKKRKKTKPSVASVQRRLDKKKRHAKNKSLRSQKPRED